LRSVNGKVTSLICWLSDAGTVSDRKTRLKVLLLRSCRLPAARYVAFGLAVRGLTRRQVCHARTGSAGTRPPIAATAARLQEHEERLSRRDGGPHRADPNSQR
jgi:hypothetical protein